MHTTTQAPRPSSSRPRSTPLVLNQVVAELQLVLATRRAARVAALLEPDNQCSYG
jgi:hypothetical protein